MNQENEGKDAASITEDAAPKRPSLLRNYISFFGIAVAAAGLVSFVLLLLISFSGEGDNPYTDLITFILIPSILGFGIFIILVGVLLERRRRVKMPDAKIAAFPVLDLITREAVGLWWFLFRLRSCSFS